MVQNHLLQLLCIIAMEPPATGDADAMRDEKLKVLRALRPIAGADVPVKTVRGQYKAGAAGGKPVPGYLEEQGVPAGQHAPRPSSRMKAEIDNWRWAGVPFYLRTGKRLQEKLGRDRHHLRRRAAFHLRRRGPQPFAQQAHHRAVAQRQHHADHPRQDIPARSCA